MGDVPAHGEEDDSGYLGSRDRLMLTVRDAGVWYVCGSGFPKIGWCVKERKK